MILLVSPSRLMDMNKSTELLPSTTPVFDKEATDLANKMKGLELEDISRYMGEDDHLARETYDLYQNFEDAPVKQAIFAYAGKFYKALGVNDFSFVDLEFAKKHLRIISTLYGYLIPTDDIRAYRMNFHLDYQSETLFDFWKSKITPLLIADIAANGNCLLDFSAQEVIKAVDRTTFPDSIQYIHVDFKDKAKDKNEYVSIRAYAQPAKGHLVRYIIKNKIDHPDELISFTIDGYSFNKELSTKTNMVFTREKH